MLTPENEELLKALGYYINKVALGNPHTNDFGSMGTLLTQEQVDGAIKRTMSESMGSEGVAWYQKYVAGYVNLSEITKRAPFWASSADIIKECLKLNRPEFWMDLLSMSQVNDPEYLIRLLQYGVGSDIQQMGRHISEQNSKFYFKSTLYLHLAALLGEGFLGVVKPSVERAHVTMVPAAEHAAHHFSSLATNFDSFVERLQQTFGGESHQCLVDTDAFSFSVMGREFKCPAIRLTDKIYTGYAHALQDEATLAHYKKVVAPNP